MAQAVKRNRIQKKKEQNLITENIALFDSVDAMKRRRERRWYEDRNEDSFADRFGKIIIILKRKTMHKKSPWR